MTTPTIAAIEALVARAAREHAGTPIASVADAVGRGLREPLRLAIAGRVKAGKSTLLNALVGEALAPTDAGECTQVVTWYRHGLMRGATVETLDGTRRPATLTRTPDAVVVDLAGPPADIRKLEVSWPAGRLEAITLIDTPGIGAIDTAAGTRAIELSSEDDPERAVDAVIYLTNQVHPQDWRFLETFSDDAGVRPDPSCAVALLSRADEVAGGAPDALDLAAAAAHTLAGDAAVRRHCQSVLPVSALLAAGAVRMTSEQHRLLAALAADPEILEALRTASRFAGDQTAWLAGFPIETRRSVLDQLGLFGVRASVALLRRDPLTSAADLVTHLRSLSGLDALVALIERQFLRRRDALRARTSLRTLWGAALRSRDVSGDLIAELERIQAADYELAELQLLADWRGGRLAFPADDVVTERLADGGESFMDSGQGLQEAALERALAGYIDQGFPFVCSERPSLSCIGWIHSLQGTAASGCPKDQGSWTRADSRGAAALCPKLSCAPLIANDSACTGRGA